MGWEYHNRMRSTDGRWAGSGEKTTMLTIRCTPLERDMIRGRAYARQLTVSAYVLGLIQRDLLRDKYDLTEDGENDV